MKWSFMSISVSLYRYIVVHLVYQAESHLLQRVIRSIAPRFLSIVVGGVAEGFYKEEITHVNPLSLVLGSGLVESV
jgi:hypothetical protein